MTKCYADAKYFDETLYGLDDIERSISQLVKQADYLNDDEKQQLIDCCFFAAQAHVGQKRRSGEPYICHPIKVAEILAKEVSFHLPVLEAAVLHDVIEDTPVTKEEMIAAFSEEVADLVDGVSKLDKDESLSPQELQARTFEKLVHAMQADPRVVMIKFADRMHNMQTLGALRPDKRRRIARETLDVYVPIASRLGMFIFKTELEELVFKQVHPWRYQVVCRLLEDNQAREETIAAVTKTLQEIFRQESVSASIRKRRRNLYNIYQKLKKSHFKRRPLENASIPFVILTDSIDDCYRVLGLIHQMYTPVFRKLTDYIASPKVNGYQSIHTAVLTKDRRVINFQIRTKAMHAVAESGIIAIWRYHNQSKKTIGAKGLPKDKSMRRWLDNIKLLSNLTTNPVEFYETVKRDLTGFEMQVLTPKGEPIGLPADATVIDFAYHIHTDIGNHLESARVNGVDVSVDYRLSDGQTVELFTNTTSQPRSLWLKRVKTARARTAVRHYLRSLPESELAKMGFREMKRYLVRKAVDIRNLEERLSDIAKKNYEVDLSVLLQKIALYEVKRRKILQELQNTVYKQGIFTNITIQVYNQMGVLAMLAEAIAQHEVNISRIHFPDNVGAKEMSLVFEVHLSEMSQLATIGASLEALNVVKSINYEEIIQ